MGLQENLRNERIDKLNQRKPVTVPITVTMRDSLSLMRDRDTGCVIVIDDDRKPIGMFTESMLTEMVSDDAFNIEEPIEKYMAKEFPLVRNTDPIAVALKLMQGKSIRLICVVDELGQVVGLTGQRGLMEYVTDHFPGQVMVQRIGQTPYYHSREGA